MIISDPIKVNSKIFRASAIYIGDAFYVIGGYTDVNEYDSTIGKLDANLTWSKVGELSTGRRDHGVIFDGTDMLVVGGFIGSSKALQTEKCIISNNQVSCTGQSPSLLRYEIYPELFLVPENFCKSLS